MIFFKIISYAVQSLDYPFVLVLANVGTVSAGLDKLSTKKSMFRNKASGVFLLK